MVSIKGVSLSAPSVSTEIPTQELALNVPRTVMNASVLLSALNPHQATIFSKDNQYLLAQLKHSSKAIHALNATRPVKHAVGPPKQIAKAVHLKF